MFPFNSIVMSIASRHLRRVICVTSRASRASRASCRVRHVAAPIYCKVIKTDLREHKLQGWTTNPHNFTHFYASLNYNKTVTNEISLNEEKEV